MKGSIVKVLIILLCLAAFLWAIAQIISPLSGINTRYFFDGAGEALSKTFGTG